MSMMSAVSPPLPAARTLLPAVSTSSLPPNKFPTLNNSASQPTLATKPGNGSQGEQLIAAVKGKKVRGDTPPRPSPVPLQVQDIILLTGAGADVNSVDRIGWTPLLYAAQLGML